MIEVLFFWLIMGVLLAIVSANLGSKLKVQIGIILLWPVAVLLMAIFGNGAFAPGGRFYRGKRK